MSDKYFKNFPLVQYGEHSVRNIMLKATLGKKLFDNFDSFYPYTVKEGERITEVAYNYYGSIDYVWIIVMSNDMIDPVYDWPLFNQDFERFIEEKYGSLATAMNIANAEYYRNSKYSYWMTKTTYNHISASERTGWTAVDNYTYELIKNEQKRKIRLLDNSLAIDVGLEMERIFRKVNLPERTAAV